MKKTALIAIVIFGVLSLQAPVNAKDMNGNFGVGFHETLGGMSGLGLRYYIGDFGLLFNMGLHLFSPSDGDSETGFGLGLGGIYNIARSEHANLGFGLVLNLAILSPPTGDSINHIEIELPLVAEYFFSDHFSIYGQVGLVINIVGENGALLHPAGGHGDTPVEGFGFGLGNGLEATGGFTFYF